MFHDGDGSGSEQLEHKVEKLNKYGSGPLYAGKEKNWVIFGLLAAIIACSLAMILYLSDHRKHFTSPYFKINIDEYTGYIYLNPKTGHHDTTVIFLDSNVRENNQFLKAFAQGKLTSNNTRIIFP